MNTATGVGNARLAELIKQRNFPMRPLSMEFSRQEHWSGLPFPSPRDLPDPGIHPGFPAWQADALPSVSPGKPS